MIEEPYTDEELDRFEAQMAVMASGVHAPKLVLTPTLYAVVQRSPRLQERLRRRNIEVIESKPIPLV